MRRQTTKTRTADSCEGCGCNLGGAKIPVNVNQVNVIACVDCAKEKDFGGAVVHPVEKP